MPLSRTRQFEPVWVVTSHTVVQCSVQRLLLCAPFLSASCRLIYANPQLHRALTLVKKLTILRVYCRNNHECVSHTWVTLHPWLSAPIYPVIHTAEAWRKLDCSLAGRARKTNQSSWRSFLSYSLLSKHSNELSPVSWSNEAYMEVTLAADPSRLPDIHRWSRWLYKPSLNHRQQQCAWHSFLSEVQCWPEFLLAVLLAPVQRGREKTPNNMECVRI